jgi:hypothetical protein
VLEDEDALDAALVDEDVLEEVLDAALEELLDAALEDDAVLDVVVLEEVVLDDAVPEDADVEEGPDEELGAVDEAPPPPPAPPPPLLPHAGRDMAMTNGITRRAAPGREPRRREIRFEVRITP